MQWLFFPPRFSEKCGVWKLYPPKIISYEDDSIFSLSLDIYFLLKLDGVLVVIVDRVLGQAWLRSIQYGGYQIK